jgi:thiol:disulfide interchange protein
MHTTWVMPEIAASHGAASEPGYAFVPSTDGVGADEPESTPRGDYPVFQLANDASGFWRFDEERARRQARASGRGLFVAFYADWSDGARRLDDHALSDVQARAAILARFVPLRVDVTEESMASREQLTRYGVDRLPAIVMLGPDGEEQDRVVDAVDALALLSRVQRAGR